MAKAIGTEIVDFYLNGWPADCYSDESIYSVMDDGRIVREDGPENAPGLPVTDRYELEDFGAIINEKIDEARAFAYYFNRWKKAQTTMTFAVQIEKSQENWFRDLMKQQSIKIIG